MNFVQPLEDRPPAEEMGRIIDVGTIGRAGKLAAELARRGHIAQGRFLQSVDSPHGKLPWELGLITKLLSRSFYKTTMSASWEP